MILLIKKKQFDMYLHRHVDILVDQRASKSRIAHASLIDFLFCFLYSNIYAWFNTPLLKEKFLG